MLVKKKMRWSNCPALRLENHGAAGFSSPTTLRYTDQKRIFRRSNALFDELLWYAMDSTDALKIPFGDDP